MVEAEPAGETCAFVPSVEGRVPISNVDDITTSEELASLLEQYPNIDEVEYKLLSPFVMQYYLESYS